MPEAIEVVGGALSQLVAQQLHWYIRAVSVEAHELEGDFMDWLGEHRVGLHQLLSARLVAKHIRLAKHEQRNVCTPAIQASRMEPRSCQLDGHWVYNLNLHRGV